MFNFLTNSESYKLPLFEIFKNELWEDLIKNKKKLNSF